MHPTENDFSEEILISVPTSVHTIERKYTLIPDDTEPSPTVLPKDDNVTRYKAQEEVKHKMVIEELKKLRKFCIDLDSEGKYGNIIGKRLKHLLEIRDMTVVELAEKSGVDRSTIHRYLSGGIPFPANLEKLINALDCDVSVMTYNIKATYEEWEDECDSNYRLRIDWTSKDNVGMSYLQFRDMVLDNVRLPLGDRTGKRIPQEAMLLLQQQLCFAFDTLDLYLKQLEQMDKLQEELHPKRQVAKQEKKK